MKKIDRTKRDVILLKILSDDLKNVEKHLKSYEKDLKESRKKKDFQEIIEGHTHTVGYFTGYKECLKKILEHMNCSAEDLINMLKKNAEIETKNIKYLDKIFKEIKNGRTRKKT